MTQKDFAEKYLNKTQEFWSMVLNNKRRLEFDDAQVVSELLKTTVGLWAKKKSRPGARKRAWKEFQRSMK